MFMLLVCFSGVEKGIVVLFGFFVFVYCFGFIIIIDSIWIVMWDSNVFGFVYVIKIIMNNVFVFWVFVYVLCLLMFSRMNIIVWVIIGCI